MNLLDAVTVPALLEAYDRLGYPVHTGPYNLNQFAVRSNVGGATGQSRQGDGFDDVLGDFYQDERGVWRLHKGMATTESGLYYLRQKLSSAGFGRPRTPIILPGYYPGVYEFGRGKGHHRGYRAGRQVAPFTYVADTDRDDYLDLGYRSLPGGKIEVIDTRLLFSGNMLTNRHRASKSRLLRAIGRNSAGCMVWQDARDLAREIALVDLQAKHGNGTRCSCALLTRRAVL